MGNHAEDERYERAGESHAATVQQAESAERIANSLERIASVFERLLELALKESGS